jgi:hypothetical protein
MFASVKTLLSSIVDYAGLFPPANLDLPQVIDRYQRYRHASESWMLGRFVLPLSKLSELVSLLLSFPEDNSDPWPLSIILSTDLNSAIAQIISFNHPTLTIQSLEISPLSPADIKAIGAQIPPYLDCFFEIPMTEPITPYLDVLQTLGASAKIRTGGIAEASFPSTTQLGQCLLAFAKAQVPFKATAGLHHALPGCHPMTYGLDSLSTSMQGFLNLAIASALAYTQRVTLGELLEVLQASTMDGKEQEEEKSPRASRENHSGFQMQMNGILWGDHYLSLAELEADLKGLKLLD